MIAELRQHTYPGKLLTEVPQCQLDMHVATAVPDKSFPMEAKRLEPGSPEAKVALLHHMINMCDGEIRLHAGRWRRYESTDVPTWSKLPQPTWEAAQALERRTHPRDQGSNFVEFHMYTDEELEDHRRLGLRPYWSYLKGSFFAYEPAFADGGVGICWEKEVQTSTLPTLLGIYGHQFSLKQLWYAWENLPIAVKRHSRGQRGGAQGAQDRIVERKKIQKETLDFLEQMQLPKPTSVEEWRLIWREVGTLLAAKHFISHTPVPVMDLPVADVVDSKEQLRFRAMCDERISFPFEELRPFEEVYAKLVAWRCNTEQWWWAEVDPAHAGPLYPLTLQEGVPIGVDEPSLGVWPTKEEFRGSPDDWEDLPSPTGRHNYDSAEAFSDSIKETFVEEKVEGPFTKQEAANRCGCLPSELCPGPMAAIDEGDKIRIIYDGSFGGANAHIQQNSTEKTTAPTVMDCVHGTSGIAPQGQGATADGVDPMSKGSVWHWPNKDSTFLLLKADVSKAHRRIKILRSGWKYQVAQIDQQWWVNKVGAYGVASAQLYWGRMAALLLRILYALFPEVDWGFVFVDDFCWVLRASNASWLTPALLGVLLALGTPLSWKKTVLSEINTWLGFVINPSGPFVQMAKEKHVAVLALLKELEEGKAFSLKAIEKATGKIQWATATCPMAKPFLQPFWAWKSAVKTAGVPGKLVRCLAVLLSQLFSKQFPQMSPFSPWSSWTGASDASAEKAGDSWIGGWLTDSPEPSKDKVLWFQYKVCQEHHPWAFKKNDPQKRIAALELYGTLFLALLLMAQNPSTSCRLHIPLVSDNQGNVYSILNNATRKIPTAVILLPTLPSWAHAGSCPLTS